MKAGFDLSYRRGDARGATWHWRRYDGEKWDTEPRGYVAWRGTWLPSSHHYRHRHHPHPNNDQSSFLQQTPTHASNGHFTKVISCLIPARLNHPPSTADSTALRLSLTHWDRYGVHIKAVSNCYHCFVQEQIAGCLNKHRISQHTRINLTSLKEGRVGGNMYLEYSLKQRGRQTRT
jgi:hypothetical protein